MGDQGLQVEAASRRKPFANTGKVGVGGRNRSSRPLWVGAAGRRGRLIKAYEWVLEVATGHDNP